MPGRIYQLRTSGLGCGSRLLEYVNSGVPDNEKLEAFVRGILFEVKSLNSHANLANQTCVIWNDKAEGRAGEALAKILKSYPELGTIFESPEYTNMHYLDNHKIKVWGFIANIGAIVNFAKEQYGVI